MNRQGAFDFSSKTVLVTGSTRNLGFSIAGAFAQSHARVILHGPTSESVAGARQVLLAAEPGALLETACFDLGKQGEIDAAFADLDQRGLAPDILVNNAAHLGLGASGFLEQSPDFFREVLEVNLFGAFRCSQLAAAGMAGRGGGSIIHVSSLAGERAIHGRSAYSASKAALDGLTRAMAVELAGSGVRVNAVVPGYVWTPRWNGLPPETVGRRKKNTPGGEPTRQAEIAQTILFLASDAAPSLLGARVVIDGGLDVQQVPRDIAL